MDSFFNGDYRTPAWLTKKLSRRHMLKSAAGATAIAVAPTFALNLSNNNESAYHSSLNTIEWQTLDSVFEHLFPASKSGPSATDLRATFYLYQLVHEQPTAQDEIDFIYRGVGWLNSYTQSKQQKNFVELELAEKEITLRAISRSEAGKNWLNMMILNLYEAMLSPPAYGGNPDGIGWEWLNHQAGFPLPKSGKRYYELPKRSIASKMHEKIIESTDLSAGITTKLTQGRTKA
jgi:gluconate 2-dehydrogenase gamma chain